MREWFAYALAIIVLTAAFAITLWLAGLAESLLGEKASDRLGLLAMIGGAFYLFHTHIDRRLRRLESKSKPPES